MYLDYNIKDFVEKTYSKSSTPGGGGVSALVGSLGSALAGMVANLTVGKKKYKEFKDDIDNILEKSKKLQNRLLELIDLDAKNFDILMDAYKIPKDDPARDDKIQEGLKLAGVAPCEISKVCYEAILLHKELLEKGSLMMISDVAVGVICLKAGLQGGYINAVVNLKDIKDKEYALENHQKILKLLKDGEKEADYVCSKALERIDI